MKISLKQVLFIFLAVLSIAIGSQITINAGPIPITGQTLAILIWAFFLTPWEAFTTIISYFLLGCLGIPVFAEGSSGMAKLLGSSGGFFIGFFVAMTLISWLYQQNKRNSYTNIFKLTVLGTVIILIFGVARLTSIYDFTRALEYGFYPFWQGALLKIFIGSFIVWGVKKLY